MRQMTNTCNASTFFPSAMYCCNTSTSLFLTSIIFSFHVVHFHILVHLSKAVCIFSNDTNSSGLTM